MGREFEIKYRLTDQAFSALSEACGPFEEIRMETTYFDTPDGALSARRWTLRRRLENGKSICTLKTPGVNGGRGEWEVPSETIDTGLLIAAGAPPELEALTLSGLVPICSAAFTRLAAPVFFGKSRLELALDRGRVLGGGKEAPIYEVEAELKAGYDKDVLRFGILLEEKFGLVPEPKSKFRRAMELTQERR